LRHLRRRGAVRLPGSGSGQREHHARPADRYRTLEDEWLKQLDENKERVHDLWKASDDNDSRDELSDVEEELGRLKDSWPYGAEWGSRADLPKAPGDNLTIKKPVTVTPTGPITF